MNSNSTTGKAGTITPSEFNVLSDGFNSYGAKVLAQKVAKICSKKASSLKHEYPSSSIAAAYDAIASKINGAVGTTGARTVGAEFFNSLTGMVAVYGPEVVTQKISKLAKRAGATADSTMLAGLFPKAGSLATSTPAPAKKAAAPTRPRW